jgi:hypothetical protein
MPVVGCEYIGRSLLGERAVCVYVEDTLAREFHCNVGGRKHRNGGVRVYESVSIRGRSMARMMKLTSHCSCTRM